MSELTDADEPVEHAHGLAERLEQLEVRVYKLETTVARTEAQPTDEDAVADRVIARLSALAEKPRTLPDPDRVLVLETATAQPPPPHGAVLHPPQPTDPTRRSWFLSQLIAEIGLIFRMYMDPRYRVSRLTQFAIPGIALILIFNYFFFAQWVSIPFISPMAERLFAVILAVIGYKLLTRELSRYREVLDYLSKFATR